MSKVKAASSTKNGRDSKPNYLGTKRYGDQYVHAGEVLVRQIGATKIAGSGAFMSRDFTIHAAQDGRVAFNKVRKGHFTGKTVPRTQVTVVAEQ